MNDSSPTGKTALVTGGGRGIGRACSLRLAGAGARVAVNYCQRPDAADQTVADITAAGGDACAVQADVSRADEVKRMIDDVANRYGPVDVLVNNAGIFERQTHETLSLAGWERTLAVNLTGTFLMTWAVKDSMIERNFGRIVNLTSIAGLRARPLAIDYAVSKAGVISFTKSIAEALAEYNIRVNAVAPGLIDTEIIADVAKETLDEIIATSPIPRFGRPEEIAELVFFLVSDESSFTTGQTFVASGGRVTLPA